MDVFGIGLPSDSLRNVSHLASRITLARADLGEYQTTLELLRDIRPSHVFHLAAQASVRRSWENPVATLVNNITAQANMLHAIVQLDLHPRVLIVGSADEYGLIAPEDLPINEGTALRPINPYAVSKIAQDFMGYQYYLSHNLPVVRVRPFNHIGPRQAPGFVVPDFCQQIALIEARRQEPLIRVGNLDARRAFSDVRDVVRGYHWALSRGQVGQVYNIGSARSVTIKELLDKLLEMSRVPIQIEVDPTRLRPSDIPELRCDSSRLAHDTGWQARYSLEETLAEVLAYWRECTE